MKTLKSLLSKLAGLFSSGKAQAALDRVAELVPRAVPIVKIIAELTPNRTDDELAAAFERLAVPFSAEYLATPAELRGKLLLHLASATLAKQYPSTATNILDSAVQLAVTGSR